MLKALLRKQLLEYGGFLIANKKNGKTRSRGAMVGLILLLGFAFISVCFAFFGMGMLFTSTFIPLGLDWLYFAMMGSIALLLGVFGDVFTTYAGLYKAKDNEFLLSMPIPPAMVLGVRMLAIYLMGLFFEAMVFIPAMIAYWVRGIGSVTAVVFPILQFFLLGAVITALSCALGWVVALISGKLKSKAVTSALLTLVLLGVYYVVYFRLNSLLQDAAAHATELGDFFSLYLYPLKVFGQGATGDVLPMLLSALISAALFAVCYYILARTFLHIVTENRGSGYKAAKVRNAASRTPARALLAREGRHFTQSTNYMLNSGLGLVMLVVLCVVLLIKRNDIPGLLNALSLISAPVVRVFPILLTAVICLALSTCTISAPSVSLEGGSIWILKTMPLSTREILLAKVRFHALVCLPLAVITAVMAGIVFALPALTVVCMAVTVLLFGYFIDLYGLMKNLSHPLLSWTNEMVPVKQSVSVAFALFGGWVLAILMAGLALVGGVLVSEGVLWAVILALLAGGCALLRHRLLTVGCRLWDQL